MKNDFYRITKKEYLNGNTEYPEATWQSRLLYGNVNTARKHNADSLVLSTYEDFIKAVEQKEELSDRFPDVFRGLYVEKHFGKKYVYSSTRAWIEEGDFHAGRINPKTFKEYRIEGKVDTCTPTLEYLVKGAGIDVLNDYLKDKPEVANLISIK